MQMIIEPQYLIDIYNLCHPSKTNIIDSNTIDE